MKHLLETGNYIADQHVTPAGTERIALYDPASGVLLGYSAVSNAQDVDDAYVAARQGFLTWRKTTPRERHDKLHAYADRLELHAQELAELESVSTGKSVAQILNEELPAAIDHIRFYAGACRLLSGLSSGEYIEGHTSLIRREPIGVVGQVAPWNYPIMMGVWKFAPAIAAGNAVVLKPSDSTPNSTIRLAELASGIFPSGVLNIVVGDRSTGKLIVEHPGSEMVSITGSIAAGADVARSAASNIKRVHLELGGKAPAIIFADADIDLAASTLADGALYNAGQDCAAPSRILVHSSKYDSFCEKLVHAVAQFRIPLDYEESRDQKKLQPVISEQHFDRITGFFTRLPAHVQVLCGGTGVSEAGWYVRPTVLGNVRDDDEVAQSEIFGPVITVQKFTSTDEAVDRANSLPYGLASSVWTKDVALSFEMSSALDFGTVWINTHIPMTAEMPHGGFKQSGYGKDLSIYGFEDYTRVKHVMVATG